MYYDIIIFSLALMMLSLCKRRH